MLLIKEEEAETSYVDYLAVEVTTASGEQRLVVADHPLLAQVDGQYLVLRQGDDCEVHFKEVPPDIVRAEAVGSGYYVPDRSLR